MRLGGLALCASAALWAQDGGALFQQHCLYCHGARGEGGRGADLTTGRYKHVRGSEDLVAVIRNGIRGTEMPAAKVTEAEARLIAAHVESLAQRGDRKSDGDATAGAAVFNAHCARCHPSVGPDLRAASMRGAAYVRESIEKPEAEIAPGFRALSIALRGGRIVVIGIRLNEDDTSVQVRDTRGALRSLAKTEIASVNRTQPSLMPPFAGRLTERQLQDVTAYVMELP